MFCETPARSGRMVMRRASIYCATVLRNTYRLRPLAQAAAAAAAALNFRHASLFCARCFAPAAAETIKLALTCQHHGVPTPGTATLSFPNLPLHTNADGQLRNRTFFCTWSSMTVDRSEKFRYTVSESELGAPLAPTQLDFRRSTEHLDPTEQLNTVTGKQHD